MTDRYQPQISEHFGRTNSEIASKVSVPLTEERLAVLGHEIRNPLSALSYALQAWPSSCNDPQLPETPLQSQLLQIMRRQVSQLTRLCNDLLDTGRSACGNLQISQDSVDARQVIENACEQIRPFTDQCGHTLTVTLGDHRVGLIGDECRLIQVLANMLHNSAKFTDCGGHLYISLENDGDTAIIRLRDNGRGICADRLRNIFSPNNGSKECSDAAGGGLGIGLRLAKSIVELHGGSIEAFSEGLGLGSTFVVRLPMSGENGKIRGQLPRRGRQRSRAF